MLDLGFDDLTQSLGHIETDLSDGDSEAPLPVLARDLAVRGHVLQGGEHEQRITPRVPMDQLGKTLRQAAPRRLRAQVFGYVWLLKRREDNFPA